MRRANAEIYICDYLCWVFIFYKSRYLNRRTDVRG